MFAKNPKSLSDVNDIAARLNEKGVNLPCPRCGKSKFSIIGETDVDISTPMTKLSAVPPRRSSLPIVIIGCDNCGYLIQHAKGPLSLLKWWQEKLK